MHSASPLSLGSSSESPSVAAVVPSRTRQGAYRVLARVYRPLTFSDLKGQDVLVQTLTQALLQRRVAHAFLLTGIQGVGKTTTARILARALNCIGADGLGRETPTPCGVCKHCVAVTEGSHPDVYEMDAASRTSIEDVREIIENVRYAPLMGRYKVMIIDEVHMLSQAAFHAMLKTLEEPPAHTIFVLATTERRKVPQTILSRCQRFMLRRLSVAELLQHLEEIASKEQVSITQEALHLLAVAAAGSVRDGLSLLDQAMVLARSQEEASQAVTEPARVEARHVRHMLGLLDDAALIEMLQALLDGRVPELLATIRAQHSAGISPLELLSGMLECVHGCTVLVMDPTSLELLERFPASLHAPLQSLAQLLSVPALTRLWQMLSKGWEEVSASAWPLQSLEMVCIRVAYAAGLPTPAEVLRYWQAPTEQALLPTEQASATTQPLALSAPATESSQPWSFERIVEVIGTQDYPVLYHQLRQDVHVVACDPPLLTLRLQPHCPQEPLFTQLREALQAITHMTWRIVLSDQLGALTLHEQAALRHHAASEALVSHPLVSQAREMLAGATIIEVIPSPS